MADEAGVGRLLVASVHQGIADVLPTRLEFYESWLNPSGLRGGRIGVAPMAAVLSFLRLEGPAYTLVAERAGDYTAEWAVSELGRVHRAVLDAAPPAIRARLVMRLARTLIRSSYGGSRIAVRWTKGKAELDIRGSIFCEVRDRVEQPLCAYYAAAIVRLMALFRLEAEVTTDRCRATRDATGCLMALTVRPAVGA